jgi:DNA-binding NarL/FixJ family response regulator
MKSRKPYILLVDDNPAIRSALSLLLQTRLNVRSLKEADSLEDLSQSLSGSKLDILILDWELPGLQKTDRIAPIRASRSNIKVVVTSSRPENGQQAIAAGADAYVCKTEPPERVVQVLRTIWSFPDKKSSSLDEDKSS